MSVDTNEIDAHVRKLVERYNPQGAESSFVLVYYEGSRFDDFAGRYRDYIATVALSGWSLDAQDGWHELESHAVKGFRAKATRETAAVLQDHILVNVGPPSTQGPAVA